MSLTAKQEMFCREYLKDLNATQAAIRTGYSERTAKSQGQRLLTNVYVESRIQSLKQKRQESVSVDSEYVLRRLKEIDELDIIDIMADDLSEFRPLKEWPKSWRTSISGLDLQSIMSGGEEPIETLVKKIKWPDKTKNLELIGKHVNVKAWEEKQESSSDTLADAIGTLIDKLPS